MTVEPGRYRHFKGGEYEVLAVATHSETHEPMVVYRPLYNESGRWVRPLAMFVETVIYEGREVRRFEENWLSPKRLQRNESRRYNHSNTAIGVRKWPQS